ncbi:unnamed protein product [Closterium sp. NIES-65]|nr:unnamed protein product [Closterium sp. NIES-65]
MVQRHTPSLTTLYPGLLGALILSAISAPTIFVPSTFQEAITCADADKWIAAIFLESEPQRQRLERGLPGCVLYADDRRLSASSLRAAGSDSFEAHGREFPYWLATKLINRHSPWLAGTISLVSRAHHHAVRSRFTPCSAAPLHPLPVPAWATHRAYAQRHGYRFVEMGEADKDPGRHPSWFKVRFLQRQLSCCCEWAFFLDSDAYFRMDNHRLSIQSWVDRLTLPHYFDWIARDYNISLANQTCFPRPPSSIFSHSPPVCPPSPVGAGQGGGEGEAGEGGHWGGGGGGEGESRAAVCVVAPRNDDEASGMAEGRAGALFNGSMEYVNAGVTLWRRSPHCLKLLASWHEEPARQYLWRRNWEQPRLNVLLAMPQHVADVAVVPFRELTGHSGRAIRHRWLNSIMTDETRSDLVKDALLGSFLTSYMYMF